MDFPIINPLNLTFLHNRYVLVMIEHFSKWLELVPLLDRSCEGTTYTFLDRVLSRFGAPIEILIDQGTKFCGEFQELCENALIDHCMTSRNHLKVDGLTKRMVKQGLRNYGLHKGHTQDWDLYLPWLAMGYRFSYQTSFSSFSPYFLLFSCELKLPAQFDEMRWQ